MLSQYALCIGEQSTSLAASIQAHPLLDMLQDISNMRRSQLQQRAGSGRTATKRIFGLALPPIQALPATQPVGQTPQQTALSTPQTAPAAVSVNRPSAHSNKNSRVSFGSAIEGILERPWRSITKTPAASITPASNSIWQYTPMEGVPERFELPHLQHSIRRQSHSNRQRSPASTSHRDGQKLETPGSIRQSGAQKLWTPVSTARPEAVLRLHLSPGDEAQLQEVSPVVGLLEPQHQPDEQVTGAEQYGSLGFFGSLCSAPPVTDAAGAALNLLHC